MRVMSLNIWNYNAPWPRRRELIIEAVRAADSDVVAFQEIRSDPDRDELDADGRRLNQAQQIAMRLPDYPHLIFRPAMHYRGGVWEGLAILSRLPIADQGWVPLTQDLTDPDDRHQRIVLHARFDLPDVSFHLFNTHLSLSRAARLRTVPEVLTYMDRFRGPRLLVGDLNEHPDQAPMEILREAGWTDVWAALHPGEPGYTSRSDEPWQRIDYAWASPELVPYLEAIELVADQPDEDGVFPSDHIGLVVTINVEWGT
ncbi:MAG TPA: hypothetical protein G4O02_13665 [Caldilineae bacterium]|nr:hypothetical protein [Caldilineae bacterium]